MYIDWLINNTKTGRGFISQRTILPTYSAICQLYGMAVIHNHGRTDEGIPIGQILTPQDIYNPCPWEQQ
jgi:hypothetical protein